MPFDNPKSNPMKMAGLLVVDELGKISASLRRKRLHALRDAGRPGSPLQDSRREPGRRTTDKDLPYYLDMYQERLAQERKPTRLGVASLRALSRHGEQFGCKPLDNIDTAEFVPEKPDVKAVQERSDPERAKDFLERYYPKEQHREKLWAPYNANAKAAGLPGRICEDCGKRFSASRRDKRFCDDRCQSRNRNRGRDKVGNGKSAVQNMIARLELWWKRHKSKCSDCRTGRVCATAEAKLQMMARLPSSAKVTPEEAQAIMQRAGRTPKRSTEPAPRNRKALTASS